VRKIGEKGKFVTGFDGKYAWLVTSDDREVVDSGFDFEMSRREALLHPALGYSQRYREARVRGKTMLEGREVRVVDAIHAKGGKDTLYFDAKTGLLLYAFRTSGDPGGAYSEEEYFSDYRKVDGTMVAFKRRFTGASSVYTVALTEVEHNTKVADSEFSPPAHMVPAAANAPAE
jgi:hypothetical protein